MAGNILREFVELPPTVTPLFKPVGGTIYLYKWEAEDRKGKLLTVRIHVG